MAIADAVIRHQIDLVQYSNGVVRRIIALLNRVDPDMAARLAAALETLPPESFTVERLEAVLESVRALNRQAYAQAAGALEQELRDFAAVEVEWQQAFFRRQIASTFYSVTAEQVYSAAMSRPFAGRLLREWSQGIEANRMTRIRDAVRIGYVSNETIPQIVRRIRGTRARQYKDGLLEIDRRHAESVVRTAISHTAGVTRDRFVEANLDIVEAVVWTSTLDSRTCFVAGTKVLTPAGEAPIEAIRPGDTVIGGSRLPRVVAGTATATARKMAKVTLSNGAVLRCTADHRFLTDGGEWKEIGQLKAGQRLAQELK